MKLKVLDLFSGIGGFSLGLEATNYFETVAFCEIDQYCQKILKKHWPNIPIFEDIKKLNGKELPKIDVITGGYPCQPFSVAGQQKADKDPRHLWPEYFRLIKELRPTWVIGENVGGHIKLGLDSVLSDLESEGYSARTFSISASSIGANHKRERVWIVANSDSKGLQRHRNKHELRKDFEEGKVSGQSDDVADSQSLGSHEREFGNSEEENRQKGKVRGKIGREDGDRNGSIIQNNLADSNSERPEEPHQTEGWWDFEPDVGRVAYGVPNRVDRLKCLGNSVVPQIPFLIGECIGKINS
jgi:DNA (cytosine-5)-methyltransferase 1